MTIALNHEELNLFMNKYNWKGAKLEKDDQRKSEKNNATVVLNVLYCKH